MKRTGLSTMVLGATALTMVTAGPASATDTADPPPDPAVVAARESLAAVQAGGPTTTADVQRNQVAPGGTRSIKDLYYLDATSTSGGFVRVFARDNPALDKPGIATTTLRIYGNAAAFRDGAGDVTLTSEFTCSGFAITGLTIGSSGFSVSGGMTSSTLTWKSSRTNYPEVRQYYTEGGHFRCKASNTSPAKTTRRGTAGTTYKGADTRAQDSYSFTW